MPDQYLIRSSASNARLVLLKVWFAARDRAISEGSVQPKTGGKHAFSLKGPVSFPWKTKRNTTSD